MGRINTLRGLNNMSVDYRPEIEPKEQNPGNVNQLLPEANAVPVDEPLKKGNAKKVVQDLDVLLLNAAGKSVTTDTAQKVKTVGKSLVNKGVLPQKEASRLESLAKDAATKLRALDKLSGREIAKALMADKKSEHGDLVWKKGFFGLNSTAKAVKAAVEAQEKLSEALAKFNDRLAESKDVTVEMQEQFMELQFQCDRRATEIYSVAVRMHDLVQQDVVNRTVADPQVAAYLDATFRELMPREAILMHGTAEALQKMHDMMGPLVAKLASFAANGMNELGAKELAVLSTDMLTMKNAIENVRRNGLEINDGNTAANDGPIAENGGRTEVDHSILDAMEKVLFEVSKQLVNVKKKSVAIAREAFLEEIRASLSPENAPGGDKAMGGNALTNSAVHNLIQARKILYNTLFDFASGKLKMTEFDTTIEPIIAQFEKEEFCNLEKVLLSFGFDATASQQTAKTVRGIRIVIAQFKELMDSTKRLKQDDADMGIATGDVRRILLGEKSLSSLVEAKARGFKPGDVTPAADESNIVGSRLLGEGSGGKTYLLTTKSGGELVFKSEIDSRIGLEEIFLGSGGAYLGSQKTANLNLATQDTAKVFGCEDIVVKYSVGSHDGQFGVFMEKAKGYSGNAFALKQVQGDDGIAPADMHKIVNALEQTKIQGAIAQKLNKLMWLDLITGQGDRHWSNYYVHVDKNTKAVTVKGIDNDASFASWRIGLQKYALDKKNAAEFEAKLQEVCSQVLGRGRKTEYEGRILNDPGLEKNSDGSMTIDLAKTKSPEIKMAIIHTLGLQSIALPEEIDKEFYDKLMEMDEDPAKKQAYLESIASRISSEALNATAKRLDEAIAHAKKLKAQNKVYTQDQWQNANTLSGMTRMQTKVEITKSNGTKLEANTDLECVKDFCERNCPSFFKRDGFHLMFKQPQPLQA